jgi:hypothetical protein
MILPGLGRSFSTSQVPSQDFSTAYREVAWDRTLSFLG